MTARLTKHGWRISTLFLLLAALVFPMRVVAAQQSATPRPGPDADAGSLVIEAVQSPADEPRVEFHVTTDAPWPVGDGFAAAAFEFTLSGPNGDQPVSTSDQAPDGLTTIDLLAGDYTLTDNEGGDSVSFTITAGATTYVAVARYFVSNPVPPVTSLPTTGSGLGPTGTNAGVILLLLALAALTGIAAIARARGAA